MSFDSTVCHVCCCSEINAAFTYKTAAEREKLVIAERKFTDERVQKVIDLKKKVRSGGVNGGGVVAFEPYLHLLSQVCDGTNKGFVVINQKVSPDLLLTQKISSILHTHLFIITDPRHSHTISTNVN